MDRDGPHGPVCVINDSTVSDNPCAERALSCDPLKITTKTRVTHPQSADETLRNGYLRHAPSNINGDFSRASICQWLLGVPTCCVGAMLLSCCWSPVLNYQLQEVRSGSAVQGVRYTEKDKSALFSEDRRNPTGDTIEFSERVPLQVRKDALAIAVYTLTLEAAKPVFGGHGGPV